MNGPSSQEIQNLFSSIAPGYDRANDWITFGMARRWRRALVRWSQVKAGARVLDCATGTGDLALEFKKITGPTGRVIGTDFCEAMLEKAPAKANHLGLDVDFQIADAMNLPFEDHEFDAVSIAYGIRNVEDPLRALNEMARVAKPQGAVLILETGNSQWPLFQTVFDIYFHKAVPVMGGWITGKRDAYEYLNRSSKKFPCRDAFTDLMKQTGKFSSVEYRALMGGASFLYKGIVSC